MPPPNPHNHNITYGIKDKEVLKAEKKKMGRPTDNPKNDIIKIRATKEDREKLIYCCEKTGMTQYEVVTKGINKVYMEIVNKK